jgi:uncharacterized RDD family membrane protein YckC
VSEVVTGEAVVLEVRVAQLPSRALAYLIDWILQCAVLVVASLLVSGAFFVIDDALATGLMILFIVLVIVGYPVACETASRGRSLGKLALGLRVVSDDGGPERFRQALFRGLAGFLEFWAFFGAPALITSLVNQKGKRLGDIFAGTVVIDERTPRQEPPPAMPPQLASWAATLELSQLPGELAGAARQYLSRWHQLSPEIRHELGARIAGQMSSHIAPPPPPGVPPHVYLAAVLAERRRREEVRLAQARRPEVPYGDASPLPPYGGVPHPPPPPPPYGGVPQPPPPPAPYGGVAPPPPPPLPYGPPNPGAARPAAPGPAGSTPGGFVPPE